jgi:hypothetical protein
MRSELGRCIAYNSISLARKSLNCCYHGSKVFPQLALGRPALFRGILYFNSSATLPAASTIWDRRGGNRTSPDQRPGDEPDQVNALSGKVESLQQVFRERSAGSCSSDRIGKAEAGAR